MKKILFLTAGLLLLTSYVFAQDMTIDSNGNVGIGEPNPTAKLDVFTTSGDAIVGESSSGYAGYFLGNTRITGDLTVDGTITSTMSSSDADTLDGLDSTDFSLAIHSHDITYINEGQADSVNSSMITDGTIQQSDLSFTLGDGHSLDAADGSPADVVYADNTGNVGIGTTTPAGKLDVIGDICLGSVCRTTWPAGSGTGAFTDTGTSAYYNGGNVGIGTTSPQGLLDVESRGLHVVKPQALSGHANAGIRLEIENTVDGGIASAYDTTTGEGGIFVGSLSNHRLGFITNGKENMTLSPDGSLGIGTAMPLQPLHVQGNAYVFENLGIGVDNPTHDLQVSGSNALLSSGTGDFRLFISKNLASDNASLLFQDNFTPYAEIGLTTDDNLHFKVSADGATLSDAMVIDHTTGYVGIGTSVPIAKLTILSDNDVPLSVEDTGSASCSICAWKKNNGDVISIFKQTGTGNALRIYQTSADPAMIIQNSTSAIFVVESTGKVGIGTSTPAGTLDVNGEIYQRGGILHADYVFEPDYQLETIEEHSEFMWKNKHLNAIPKATVDSSGKELIKVGSHRRGIVEELEKAHIYIDRLNEQVKEQNKIIQTLEQRLAKIETKIDQ